MRHLSYYPTGTEKSISDDEDGDNTHSKDSDYERSGRTRGRYKQRDVRRSKSEVRPSDLRLAEDEYNRKTSADNKTRGGALTLSVAPAMKDPSVCICALSLMCVCLLTRMPEDNRPD